MVFLRYGAIVLTCLMLLPAKSAYAETVKVSLTADEIKYDYGSKQIEAIGNVKINYKKTKIESDHAIIDHQQNVLLATGKVKVVKEDDEFNGDRFLYYLETRQGWVFPVVTEVTDEEINGELKYTATEAFLKGEEILFKRSFVTGCDLEKPHYHFTAKEAEYVPGDKIKMRHAVYWEHRIPLFYFPLLVISLEEGNDNFGVRVGWNNYDGWWILAWYTYYFTDDNSLLIRNKTTEYGVDRWELQYIDEISSTKKFTGAFEFADNNKIGNPNDDYRTGLKYEDRTHPKLNYDTTLDNWRRYTTTGETYIENEYNFTLRGQSPYPFLAIDYDTFGIEGKRQINLQENWRHNFDSNSSFSLSGRWFYNELETNSNTGEAVQSYNYDSRFDKKWDWSQLAIRAQQSKTLGYYSENVIPDIVYSIPKWEFPLIGDLKTVIQYTDKEKYNGITNLTTEGERWAIDLEKYNNLWAKESLRLTNRIYYRFRDYSVDEYLSELNAITEELNLTKQFTAKLTSTVSLGYTELRGENNTFFNDTILPGAEIWNSWRWQGQHLGIGLKTGYNYETQYAHPVNLDTSWVSDTTRVNFHTEYHWDNGAEYQTGLGQTRLEINSNPKQDWYLMLRLNYDFWSQTWWERILNVRVTQQVSKNWKVALEGTYDMYLNDFSNANASLIYDWHCREVEFHYDWVEQEYWLGITFKVFPQYKLNTSDNPWEYLNYE